MSKSSPICPGHVALLPSHASGAPQLMEAFGGRVPIVNRNARAPPSYDARMSRRLDTLTDWVRHHPLLHRCARVSA